MPNLVQRLSLQLKQSPQQVLLSSLLQLPILSLEQKIKMELEMNPLLELDEEMELVEEMEEEPELKLEAEKEENTDGEAEAEDDAMDEFEKEEVDWDSILNDEDTYDFKIPKDESAEVFERPEVAQTTLPEHLLSQLHMTDLSEEELVVGEYIIWSISEDGYLTYSIETIAENLDVDVEVVEKVLKVIQQFDPVGIGARNLQECLLIQMMDKDPKNEIALAILREHFEDFKNKRYERIAKKMEITLDEIRAAITDITKLNPKPGEGYVVFHQNVIVPDLTVEKENGDFRIIMNDWNVPHLRINNSYKKLLLDKKKSSKETRDYIRQSLESARWLINSIHQRRATILRVMEAIIDKQRDFFEHGTEHLKPMILKDIADQIGMDISTISRVTNGKYVQTEFGVFELKHFFSERIRSDAGDDVSNKRIKSMIKEIIEKEDPNKPLNDQKIADLLKGKGFNVARRTVAKYREQMMIPVSRLRRKL
ncbi:RNA polymerase factor sigma-54 [candidate division KSB1 bacterium]|nr:RNA polymerase factor sigma-54 [candidate division KSB1 bacterium]NIR68820.1 RNA polymerase factor sigma-54 [candidate division KSB1 bacterium]NIS27183.1 RNA polymerase factor sigma-54 [candidate division KSB1 bacterium]NIT74068.1 RNA polymerase factor sigma-54 [candidate division KSB1 bacterium]NIU26933.1 RNA polymerase factor sigma-54 [candidate division KSB1 bacterium]